MDEKGERETERKVEGEREREWTQQQQSHIIVHETKIWINVQWYGMCDCICGVFYSFGQFPLGALLHSDVCVRVCLCVKMYGCQKQNNAFCMHKFAYQNHHKPENEMMDLLIDLIIPFKWLDFILNWPTLFGYSICELFFFLPIIKIQCILLN